jgi:hypothetical protein
MIVPVAVPSFTRRSNCTTACEFGDSVPSPATGNGGVRSAELTYTPAASGDDPPSGCPTGRLFNNVEFATYVVNGGTLSTKRTSVAGIAPVL